MAEPKSDEITKLKEENEALKKKLNPLTDQEKSRINELHGLLASTLSTSKEFEELRKEYLELSSRVSNESTMKLAAVSNSRKIGG